MDNNSKDIKETPKVPQPEIPKADVPKTNVPVIGEQPVQTPVIKDGSVPVTAEAAK